MWQYVMYSYQAFWSIILVLCGLASMVFDALPALMTGIPILGSWSPTIVLLLMLKKLKPSMTIKDFHKSAFQARLNIQLLVVLPVIVFGIFLFAVWLLPVIENTSFMAQLTIPVALGGEILLKAFQGPAEKNRVSGDTSALNRKGIMGSSKAISSWA